DANRLDSLRRFLRILASRRPNLVYVIDTAVSGATAAIIGRLLRGTRFVVDTGDLGYELAELTATPGWAGRKIIGLVEGAALRLADAIVVRGSYHRTILEEVGHRQVWRIRDGIKARHSRREDVSQLRHNLGLENSLCVGMIGAVRWNRRYEM